MKLNKNKVQIIKDIILKTEKTDEEIAVLFNVSRTHINHIRHGYRWNKITGFKQVPRKTITRSESPKEEMILQKHIFPKFDYKSVIDYKKQYRKGGYEKPVLPNPKNKDECVKFIKHYVDYYSTFTQFGSVR